MLFLSSNTGHYTDISEKNLEQREARTLLMRHADTRQTYGEVSPDNQHVIFIKPIVFFSFYKVRTQLKNIYESLV